MSLTRKDIEAIAQQVGAVLLPEILRAVEKPLRGRKAIADFLGYKNPKTLERYEGIPMVRDGRELVAYPSDLNRWLKSRFV